MILAFVVFLGVFVLTFSMDLFYVAYLRCVAKDQPARAAFFSVLTHLNGVINISAILHHPRNLAAVCLGAFAGTYFSVWRSRKHSKE